MITNKYYVYTYSYPDGTPFYVGKGSGRRYRVHLCNAKAGRHLDSFNIKVIKKLLDKGLEPIIKKIKENIDNEFASLIEQEFIAKYGRRDIKTGILTNCTAGGDGTIDASPEIKKMKADTLKKAGLNTRFKSGFIPWNKGKPVPSHVAEMLRKANLGKSISEETKKALSLANKGRVFKKIECPKCKTIGGLTVMKRWHFDKCTGAKNFRARVTINGKRIHIGRFETKEDAKMAENNYRSKN